MKLLKSKSVLLLVVLLAVFYFTNDFALIDIEKTAIVVAIGVDESEQGYRVTAQIAVPQATDTASSNDDAVITSDGKTPFEAIESIAAKSGWHAKLSFCGVIILGRAVAEKSATAIIDYLVSSEKFENSTLAVVSDTTAEDILLADTPLDAISSFALQKIVLKNEWMTSPVNVTNIKKFAVGTYSRSKAAYLPVIKIIKGDNKGKAGSSSAVTAAAENSSSSSGSGNGEKKEGSGDGSVVFDASSAALFNNGKYLATLDGEHAEMLTMLSSPVHENFIDIQLDDKTYYMHVDCTHKSVDVSFDGSPVINYALDLKLKVIDSTAENPLTENDDRSLVTSSLIKAVKEKAEKTIEELHRTLAETNCDVLAVKNNIYKFHNSEYDRYGGVPLSEFGFGTNVKVKSLD